MAKTISIEEQLNQLSATRGDPSSDASKAELTRALKHKFNAIAAKAAVIITDSRQSDFLPSLAAAFDRFFVAGSDKGCSAKTAIATAFYELGHTDSAAFVRGVRHTQPEPSFGRSVDAATELRGICALGLARIGYADVLLEVAGLLVDPEPQARIMAVRAVAYTGSDIGSPLLRMKVLAGDAEPDVTAECLVALMKVSPKKSLEFVGPFLKSNDLAMVDAAAQAIGGWRSPQAFEFLRDQWESHLTSDPRRPLLLAMAMTRQPAAIEFLLERIVDDRPGPAADAVAAMAMYRSDSTLKERVRGLVETVDDATVRAAYVKAFGA